MENTAVAGNFPEADAGHGSKLFEEVWRGGFRAIGALDVDGIVSVAGRVTGPEIELIDGTVGGFEKDDWVVGRLRSSFGNVKGQ